MATYTLNVKISTTKDLRKDIMEMLVVNTLKDMNVSVEAASTEKPVSVEIAGKK